MMGSGYTDVVGACRQVGRRIGIHGRDVDILNNGNNIAVRCEGPGKQQVQGESSKGEV